MRNYRLPLKKQLLLRKEAIKLNIPTFIKQDNQQFILDDIKKQRIEAVKTGKKLQKKRVRFRIKFYGQAFGIYGEYNEKKSSKKK